MRNEDLCCIDLPDCPRGFEPEIPVKPFHMFPIKKLVLGCKEKKKKTRKNRQDGSKSVSVMERREKMESDLFKCPETGILRVSYYIDCFVYGAMAYFVICEIKEEKTWSELKVDMILYLYLPIMYEMLILVFASGCYMLYFLIVLELYLQFSCY